MIYRLGKQFIKCYRSEALLSRHSMTQMNSRLSEHDKDGHFTSIHADNTAVVMTLYGQTKFNKEINTERQAETTIHTSVYLTCNTTHYSIMHTDNARHSLHTE